MPKNTKYKEELENKKISRANENWERRYKCVFFLSLVFQLGLIIYCLIKITSIGGYSI